ncbi:conserved hypothetical protein [Trichinella spiralis]|uniref:hypothetical protein n=1 Tax=Trichinella spiralis TaxID=6334 RepID=UPI0001EFD060|nr:conserved hypothetical protein [Trichinella spiralis]
MVDVAENSNFEIAHRHSGKISRLVPFTTIQQVQQNYVASAEERVQQKYLTKHVDPRTSMTHSCQNDDQSRNRKNHDHSLPSVFPEHLPCGQRWCAQSSTLPRDPSFEHHMPSASIPELLLILLNK